LLQVRSSTSVVVAAFVASLVLTGCASVFSQGGGSRPFVYKQGPADPPETIQEKAGVVAKREEPAPPPARTAAASPPAARAPERSAAAPAPVERSAPAPAFQQPPSTASAAAPVVPEAMGGYTQASRYGDLLFISGQIGNDLRSGAFDAGGDVEAQTRRAMDNVRAILENNRLTMANVLSVTIYLANISHLTAVDRIYHGFFKGTPPARTVVEVAHLPRGALIEVSAVAGR